MRTQHNFRLNLYGYQDRGLEAEYWLVPAERLRNIEHLPEKSTEYEIFHMTN